MDPDFLPKDIVIDLGEGLARPGIADGEVLVLQRLRESPKREAPPQTFFFADMAAAPYRLAIVIVKFINNLAATINGDPAVRNWMKVEFLPDGRGTPAEHLIPASVVSNRISTAGYEAGGTST